MDKLPDIPGITSAAAPRLLRLWCLTSNLALCWQQMLSETHTTAPFRRRLSSDLLRFGNVTQLFFCGLCGADVISGRLAEVEKKVPLSFFVGRNIAWCLVDSHQESEVKTQDVLWLILQGRLVQWFPSQVNVSFLSQCSNPNYSLFFTVCSRSFSQSFLLGVFSPFQSWFQILRVGLKKERDRFIGLTPAFLWELFHIIWSFIGPWGVA